MKTATIFVLALGSMSAAAAASACGGAPSAPPASRGQAPATTAEPPAQDQPGRAHAQQIADDIMAKWQRENPDRDWEAEVRERHGLVASADNSALVPSSQGQTYGRISETDVLTWKRETEKLALAGSRIFHDADLLGSTNGVSCDMCHPHAANTHPETYPKFQVQLGRVAHLRDMINWCIEQPLRGKPLAADDTKMRALEAYILAQRKGTPLNYGKR
jgi:thiosulfate dehydrogenase